MGSPPHTRGKGSIKALRACILGITPAHAGKSFQPLSAPPDMRDHPRTRGEKRAKTRPEPHRAGSPPHTRGKATGKGTPANNEGITPAHAGKSHLFLRNLSGIKDHPRTRGEKREGLQASSYLRGSPPHTRGKADRFKAHMPTGGITPAHAGKSTHR